MIVGKTRLLPFQPKNLFLTFFFYQKHIENIIETLVNQYMAQKMQKITPKSIINSVTKNLSKLKYIFLDVFKVRKYLILTSLII